MKKIILILLISLSSNSFSQQLYMIRNVANYGSYYLRKESKEVNCGIIYKGDKNALWTLEPVEGTSLYRIRNYGEGTYLNTETTLKCSSILPGWQSAMWEKINLQSGYFRFKNYWRKTYLNHTSTGLQCTDVLDSTLSANWDLEPYNPSSKQNDKVGFTSDKSSLGTMAKDAGEAPTAIQEDVVTIGNVTYSSDKTINANKIILKRGCRMRVSNGSTLTINANEIEVETNYTIDATGNSGASKGEWCAHNCQCGYDIPFSTQEIGHEDFEKQKALGDKENKGGDGGNGGAVYITYCISSGIDGGNLTINASGGQGGRGLYLKCPCHSNENFRWASGDKGADGYFSTTRNCR